MSTSTMPNRQALNKGRASAPSAGPVLRGRRIRPARVLGGVLLVLLLALAGVVVAVRVDTRVPVLAAAGAIGAGQMVTALDLTAVKVATDGLVTIPAAQLATVVGRVAAVPLVAGTLLSPAQFGGPAWPASGEAVIAVPVKPGRLPAGLGAGAKVAVLVVPGAAPGTAPGTSGGGSTGGQQAQVEKATATVVSVDAATDQSGATVVTLLLAAGDATRIASAAGDVALVQLGG
jgi:hypothetical protein